ncbi:hypothetical protein AB0M29_43715 [Streptomyces sp. NPDC051976]|uniref:hypothetical protein n=1 Tax=Streptomyces sp. NPDC051976 TaxID=3154947 RepID=UPI003424ACAA
MARPRRRALLPHGADGVSLSWEELTAQGKSTPPFEPSNSWGTRCGSYNWWSWSPQREAAAGQALAHLLAPSEGRPVMMPDGLIE